MSIMRSSNPTLSARTFENVFTSSGESTAMTLQGTVTKVLILLLIVILSAIISWNSYFKSYNPQTAIVWMAVGGIGGFILALITSFKKTWSPVTAPIYAFLEGLFLGGLSATVQAQFVQQYPNIVLHAVLLTLSTLFMLLFAYKSGLIKATENFKLGVFAATGGIFMMYLVSFILSLFGINMGFIHGNGIIGIGMSVFIVIIAALNLVMDFDFIESGVESGSPKYMEWYAAFGLTVTLVWLYVEFLRLLSKIASRN